MATPPVPDRATPPRLKRALRGYETNAVDTYVTQILRRLEQLSSENRGLHERAERLAEKVALHEQRGLAIQEALVTAQTLQREARESAAAEADRIRVQATADADEIVQRANQELSRARDEIEEMRRSASGLRDEVKEEIRELRNVAREEAEAEAGEIRRAAEAEADQLREEARQYAEDLRDRVARLEARRVAFVEFVQELNTLVSRHALDTNQAESEPLNLYFHG